MCPFKCIWNIFGKSMWKHLAFRSVSTLYLCTQTFQVGHQCSKSPVPFRDGQEPIDVEIHCDLAVAVVTASTGGVVPVGLAAGTAWTYASGGRVNWDFL